MNYKRITAALLVIGSIIIISAFVVPADDPVSRIIAQLDKWATTHPQEKVYLQLDKPYYAIGDDIWFKAYVTTGNHQLSAISGVLNVELIDDRDSVKESLKLPMISGLTWGDFALPDTLKEGNYRIRAYTNWMRNAGDEYFFDKPITVSNSITNNVFTNTTYTYNNQNKQQQVSAVIKYTDLNGSPYINSPVNYLVQVKAQTVFKGKGQTDASGNLHISFMSPAGSESASGRIITNLKLDKRTVQKSVLIKAVSANVDVQFFPEGGSLVYGNSTRVAFKAVGADGLGADIKGVVTDNDNKQIATFSSAHLGMGVFDFDPQSGKTYKAQITYADGSVNMVDLPAATNSGYSLSINNAGDDKISIKINPGSDVETSNAPTGLLGLIAQSGGVVYYAGKSKPGSKSFTTVLPKNRFPTGIVQFTLFSSTGEPLNERLVFIQNHDQLKLDVNTGKQNYATREKVKISLNAKDKDNQPVTGSFSVSVADETKVPVDEAGENSIFSNLLLTSDLKGYIEQPGYYFAADDAKTKADLDVLMLTQGYHRFEWKQVMEDNFAPIPYAAEKTLQISGHVKTLGGKPVPNGKVTLFTSQGGLFMLDTVTDNEGRFVFNKLIFRDSVRFLLQGRNAKNRKNLKVDVDNKAMQQVAKNNNGPAFMVNFDGGLSPFLLNSKANYNEQVKYGIANRSILLTEVVIKDKREQPIKNSSNLNGPGNADQVIKASDLALGGCANIADCLQGRLLGVVFRDGMPYLTRSLNNPMQIIIDGITVTSDILTNINATDVENIEVLRSIMYTSIYGGKGSGGVLIITMKTGGANYGYKQYAPDIITFIPKGYSKVREFYSPQYDNPKTNAQIADLRSTIYWKPNIVTDKTGNATFEYFNADAKGTYRVVIEGIDADGNLGRQVYRYKVE